MDLVIGLAAMSVALALFGLLADRIGVDSRPSFGGHQAVWGTGEDTDMWRYYYDRAVEMRDDRVRETERERLAARVGSRGEGPISGLRRRGALAAAWLAERLDDCAAREALLRSADGRAG